jgi:hypothetical protein
VAEWKTRGEVLDLLRSGRANLEAALGRIDEGQLERPGMAGGEWSAKDLMAHVTFWESAMVQRLGGPKPAVEWTGDLDSTNAAVYAASRSRSLADVRRDFDAVYRDLVARVEMLSDDELNSVRAADDQVVWEQISNETWGHYPEHVADLESGQQIRPTD